MNSRFSFFVCFPRTETKARALAETSKAFLKRKSVGAECVCANDSEDVTQVTRARALVFVYAARQSKKQSKQPFAYVFVQMRVW